MSNLISHPKQKQAINLDAVGSIYHSGLVSTKIAFIYSAVTDDYEQEVEWKFETVKEADEVYNKILD